MTLNHNWFLNATGQFTPIGSGQINLSTTTTTGFLTYLTKATTADITISTTSYTDGPSVSQGSSGTWLASGTITLESSVAASLTFLQLWDGTTTIASCETNIAGLLDATSASLSGVISSPAGNLRISGRVNSGGSAIMRFNNSGLSADCTLTAIRIG